jgi:hypothetical protein
MIEATYICSRCRKEHTHRFADAYRPFLAWMETCPQCRKYTRTKLVDLVVSGVKKRLTSWPTLTRKGLHA